MSFEDHLDHWFSDNLQEFHITIGCKQPNAAAWLLAKKQTQCHTALGTWA